MPLRDIDDSVFVDSLLGKIGRELLSQQPGMGADNAVFTGVVAGIAMEDPNADLLLGRLFRRLPNCTVGYVKQEIAQAGRRLKVLARGNALDQGPSRVSQYLDTDFGS